MDDPSPFVRLPDPFGPVHLVIAMDGGALADLPITDAAALRLAADLLGRVARPCGEAAIVIAADGGALVTIPLTRSHALRLAVDLLGRLAERLPLPDHLLEEPP